MPTPAEITICQQLRACRRSLASLATAGRYALVPTIPGLDDAQAEATLKAKRHAVLAQNHAALTKAIANDNPPPPLYNPYSGTITAKPYTNGESFDPSGQ